MPIFEKPAPQETLKKQSVGTKKSNEANFKKKLQERLNKENKLKDAELKKINKRIKESALKRLYLGLSSVVSGITGSLLARFSQSAVEVTTKCGIGIRHVVTKPGMFWVGIALVIIAYAVIHYLNKP